MIHYEPPSKERVDAEYRAAPSFLRICWTCHARRGRHLYAIVLPICEEWAIRIACSECARRLNNVVWYNKV
jgi:hypothetical protein